MGAEEIEGKRETAQGSLFLPLKFANVAQRAHATLMGKKRKWGRGKALGMECRRLFSLGGSAFPKRNKDGRNFQKARSESGHCNCQSVTFPPSLLVQKLERGSPLGCSVNQDCCSYLALLQCRHLFFFPPLVKLENNATWKAINFLQTHAWWWPQYLRKVASLVQGWELAGAAHLKTDLWLCNPVGAILMQAFRGQMPLPLRFPSSPTNTPLCKR